MKTTIQYTDAHFCTCHNQHLLNIGSTCELCMGQVTNPHVTDAWPEPVKGDPFDELYFEELESFYEDIEYAA